MLSTSMRFLQLISIALLFLTAALAVLASDAGAGHASLLSEDARAWLASPAGQRKREQCLPVDQIPVQGRNLTQAELALLPSLCWRRDLQPPPAAPVKANGARGIPAGVRCNQTQWYVPLLAAVVLPSYSCSLMASPGKQVRW